MRSGRRAHLGLLRLEEPRDAEPTEREFADVDLVEVMREIHSVPDGTHGVPRMYETLRKRGVVVNRKRVRRLMRRHGLAGRFISKRCRRAFASDDAYPIPDLIGRRFAPGRPDVSTLAARKVRTMVRRVESSGGRFA